MGQFLVQEIIVQGRFGIIQNFIKCQINYKIQATMVVKEMDIKMTVNKGVSVATNVNKRLIWSL